MTTSSEKARLLMWSQRILNLRHPNLLRMLALPGGAGLVPAPGESRRLSDFTPAGTFKRFELEQVVGLLLDVLCALTALHEQVDVGIGFVHGQVSPQHIYVGLDGTARLVPLLPHHWTPNARPQSTGYAAPELLLGDPVDPRSDLFSVGVMLWEALAETPLFSDPSHDAVITRLLGGKIPPLVPARNNRWAGPLCAIAERAISADPRARFQSAVELSNAIGAAAGSRFGERGYDTWQDEAPTLIRSLPAHAFPLRRLTPPAIVLDIEPLLAPPRKLPAAAGTGGRRATVTRAGSIAAAALLLSGAAFLTLSHGITPRPGASVDLQKASVAASQPTPQSSALAVAAMAVASANALPSATVAPASPSATSVLPSLPPPRTKSRRPHQPSPAARAEDYGI